MPLPIASCRLMLRRVSGEHRLRRCRLEFIKVHHNGAQPQDHHAQKHISQKLKIENVAGRFLTGQAGVCRLTGVCASSPLT